MTEDEVVDGITDSVAMSLSKLWECSLLQGIVPIQEQTHIPCIGRWILYH